MPIAFSSLYSGAIFYAYDFEKPAIWIALYASSLKCIWGIFGATLVLGSAVNTGCEWMLRCFICVVWLLRILRPDNKHREDYSCVLFLNRNWMEFSFSHTHRDFQKYPTDASIPNNGTPHILCLFDTSNDHSFNVRYHAQSILDRWFSSGKMAYNISSDLKKKILKPF